MLHLENVKWSLLLFHWNKVYLDLELDATAVLDISPSLLFLYYLFRNKQINFLEFYTSFWSPAVWHETSLSPYEFKVDEKALLLLSISVLLGPKKICPIAWHWKLILNTSLIKNICIVCACVCIYSW